MTANIATNNYISSFDTIDTTYAIYHNNIIIFGPQQLSDIVFPGLLHELKAYSQYQQAFHKVVTSPSRYNLPSYINPDKLTQSLRLILSKSLIFIHTWSRETSSDLSFLDSDYNTYEEFFETVLTHIITIDSEITIRKEAIDLRNTLRKYYLYMGSYHGNLKSSINTVKEIMTVIFWTILVSNIF